MFTDAKTIHNLLVTKDGQVFNKQGKPLKGCDNGRGYLIVTVLVEGRKTSKAIHRLVAEAWIENPDNLPEVNHKDFDKRNNRVENLEWTTRGANISHCYANNGRSATGEDNSRCVTAESIVRQICDFLQQGYSAAQIRDMGYDYDRIRAIKSRKNWRHISADYNW